jgi:Xaa-Pro dipeptidase
MNLATIQAYLRSNRIDGWLLYDFRGSNPIALHVAGLQTSGSRRWFLWIPAAGEPTLADPCHRGSTFRDVRAELRGEMQIYAGWRELEELLRGADAARPARASPWSTARKTPSPT